MFRLRLGSGGQSKITSMKIRFNQSKAPVKVKVRKYPAEQQNFLDEYLSKLVELNSIKPCLQAAWQATPHSVPKYQKSGFVQQ